MEQERFVSGYCRQLDGSRVVEVIEEDGVFQEADCALETASMKAAAPSLPRSGARNPKKIRPRR